jgi:hypothetical protein
MRIRLVAILACMCRAGQKILALGAIIQVSCLILSVYLEQESYTAIFLGLLGITALRTGFLRFIQINLPGTAT